MDLKGKVVLITGISRGLGRALAVEFSAAGCHVVGIGREQAKLAETAELIQGEFTPIICDVSDHQDVAVAVQETLSLCGRVDILFNNAALYPKISFLEETAETWAAALGANVNGTAFFCKAVLPSMLQAGQGRIYNLGSWAHLNPIPKSAAYSASKAAVHALTRAIAQDIANLECDVQIHEWIPGHLKTRMSDEGGIDPQVSARWAVEMVRNDAASKANTIFENDREWVPPKRIKDRILDMLLFR